MFGMSVFQSVLERLKAEQDTEGLEDVTESIFGDGPRHAPIDRSPFFAVETPAQPMPAFGDVARAYRELAPAETTQPVMPAHLQRTSLAEVAEELAITEMETTLTLAVKRRRFAAANHPDRLPADFRASATIRMKLANMLIDEATRRLVR